MIRYIKKYDPLRSYNQMNWTIKDVWNYTKTNTTLELVEENIRITKLVFPVKTDATWNANAFNTQPELKYKYLFTDQVHAVNGTNFDQVLCVEQRDDKRKNAIR